MISRTGKGNGVNGNASSERIENGEGSLRPGPVLITGGAGFVGTNLAHRLLSNGERVVLYDNLSRPGVEQNLAWLMETHGDLVSLKKADVRDFNSVLAAMEGVSHVFHFAAQVAVTTSLDDPFADFEVNARGTLNVLEAIRRQARPPSLLFTSTNKVYGDLADVRLRIGADRYEPHDHGYRRYGFGEDRALNFHSPYGCSKGAACQYVLDYARTFGLRTTVFRMSCIYGPHQFGTEDQGWVAHFLIKALNDDQITIYGDGRQVRDILYVDDLVDAFLLARERIEDISGEVFNMGGGPENTISLLELLNSIRHLNKKQPQTSFSDWRPADQQYYVSDTRKFSRSTGWQPRVNAKSGICALYEWLKGHRSPSATPVHTQKPGVVRARRRSIVKVPEVHSILPGANLLRKKKTKRSAPRRLSQEKEISVTA
jgi:CDP-paratose 2-epimerase